MYQHLQDIPPFLETLLDSIPMGIYVLDDKGNYLYANRLLSWYTGLPKQDFLKLNVLQQDSYNVCVSEIVYRTKKPVTMFQDVKVQATGKSFRQLITSTPIFDGEGNIRNLIAVMEPVRMLNKRFQTARSNEVIATHTITGAGVQDFHVVAYSKEMQNVLALARQVANVDSSVLMRGESGTGKEIVAHYLHRAGARRDKPFVVINCASLPENLLESELFGYEKGAFTGASTNGKRGLIEEADGGTLFLDEINSMPMALQGKLLRVLETKTSRRIGSLEDQAINFRLVAATNQSLQKMCAEGTFREDLYYRLNVVPIQLPPLRNRIDDIVPLANQFMSEFCNKYNKVKSLSSKAFDRLLQYDWPGNVRELRNFIERLIVTTSDDTIEINEIPDVMFGLDDFKKMEAPKRKNYIFVDQKTGFASYEDNDFSLKNYMENCEKHLLETILKTCGNTYKAAEILKVDQSSVVRKKNKYKIEY